MASTSKPEVSSDQAKSSEEHEVDNDDEDDEELVDSDEEDVVSHDKDVASHDKVVLPEDDADEIGGEGPTEIWWDMENAETPFDVPPSQVYDRIVNKLRAEGYRGPVTVTATVGYQNSFVPPDLSPEITLVRALTTNRPATGSKKDQVADEAIKAQIKRWLKLGRKPQVTMLITGDYDFRSTLADLSGAGHTILLAFRVDHNQNINFTEKNKHKLAKLAAYAKSYWNLRVFMSVPEKQTSKRVRSIAFEQKRKTE